MCMYMHTVKNKGKDIKASKSKSDREEDDNKAQPKNTLEEDKEISDNENNESKLEDIVVDMEEEVSPKNGNTREESVDEANLKVLELESELASNKKIIGELKEAEAYLKVELKTHKEQVEKLMRVASNMHKEIKGRNL